MRKGNAQRSRLAENAVRRNPRKQRLPLLRALRRSKKGSNEALEE
jgi:hypothetical protein